MSTKEKHKRFIMEKNEKIGAHLSKLIDEKFKNTRQFCIAYIEAEGIRNAKDAEEIRKTVNRVSQILKGKKSIQTYDLPIFTKLLEVSCEEILSAGKCFNPVDRLTNYSVAFSQDENIWQQYIDREDKLILNSDEYGKTVIDYALEFKNFEFLKFLMENEYIEFVGKDENKYIVNFGANTKIKRRPPLSMDTFLQNELFDNVKLRTQMISLAIENNALEMLDQLHAREIPSLYQYRYMAHMVALDSLDFDKHYDEDMVIQIANASEEILDYFFEEFEITDRVGQTSKFMFPYMTELIDLLVEKKHIYAEEILRRALKHNQWAYHSIEKLIENVKNDCLKEYLHHPDEIAKKEMLKKEAIKDVMSRFDFYENDNLVSFNDRFAGIVFMTNIIHANKTSGQSRINSLIEKLNDYYDKIRDINHWKDSITL